MMRPFDPTPLGNMLSRWRSRMARRKWSKAPTSQVEDIYYLHRVVDRRGAAWDREGQAVESEHYRRKSDAGEDLDPFPKWQASQRRQMAQGAAEEASASTGHDCENPFVKPRHE